MNRQCIIGISGVIAKQMLTMMAAATVFIAMAEALNWACILASREK